MQRLDQLLVNKGLVSSRTLAQRLIKENCIEIKINESWKVSNKASAKFSEEADIRIIKNVLQRYVSRAGLKLEGAIQKISLELGGLTVLDVGQSTGGFTDCVLQHGAKRVIGVDVGHEQLHTTLKSDERVIYYEGVNARELLPEQLGGYAEDIDLVVLDLSFISQTHVLPTIARIKRGPLKIVSLVKPQFEVGKEGIGKGGLVRDKHYYPLVKNKICEQLNSLGFGVRDYFQSSIEGSDGNTEFFVYAIRHNIE